MSFWFGEFELDEERRQLLRSGEPIPLEPKAYELLSLLVERRPRVLSRRQIRDVIWAGTYVSESALARLVNAIRNALGDDAREPRFIRTAHRFGYAFCGEARESQADGSKAGTAPAAAGVETPASAAPELTSEGTAREQTAAAPSRRWRIAVIGTGVAVLVLAGWLVVRRKTSADLVAHAIDSVAVLPFENVGGDPEDEYLSDGVTEDIINKLSRFHDLRVIARSTSFRFRDRELDPRRVGRDLGVGAVLTGRVVSRGATLVIAAELVDVAQGTQLWGERYNAGIGDIFAVQENIARDIARELRLKLSPGGESPRTERTTNDEAYRLYLLSRHELNKGSPEGSKKGLEYAQQATEKDPTYAPAYAVLAGAYNWLGAYELLSAREAYSNARATATKALEIDERLPEGHRSLASALRFGWDWAGAERELRRAIELDPNSADSLLSYGDFLVSVGGRPLEGIGYFKRALKLDPLSPRPRALLGWGYYFDRRYDEALGMGRQAAEFGDDTKPLGFIGMSYREKGMFEQAIAEMRKREAWGDIPFLAHLGNTYARAGRAREARECLRKMRERSRGEDVGAYGAALIYVGLGEEDEAFKWLERAYEARDKGMSALRVDPPLDPLRSDPRFQDLLRRMNFPS